MIIAGVILTGFLLSIVAWMRLCTDSCADTHNYRLFGLPFEPIGLSFFALLGGLHFLSRKHSWCSTVVALLIFGAIGAEILFILVQKFELEEWCPICLSIAATLGIAGIVITGNFFKQFAKTFKQGDRNMIKRKLMICFSFVVVLFAGFFLASAGTGKQDLLAEVNLRKEGPLFGNKQSSIEVYVITDWFCPACKNFEDSLEKMYPIIAKKAGITFVDFPIHPESLNYIPYHLSFLINEKQKYFEIRKALQQLALKTKAPTVDDIQTAIDPLNVKYRPLNFIDIDSGMQFFEGIVKKYAVKSTPTVVIVNHTENKSKLLHGSGITKKNIIDAIKELSLIR